MKIINIKKFPDSINKKQRQENLDTVYYDLIIKTRVVGVFVLSVSYAALL